MKVRMAGKKVRQVAVLSICLHKVQLMTLEHTIKELQLQKEKHSLYLVDYLDLLMPVSAKVSPNDQFVKDKYVSEELRNLAKELDCIIRNGFAVKQ